MVAGNMREHPSDRVDLRSDTVTQPTDEMRKAMSSAPVGDDVLGDDLTVIESENRLSLMLGKEAALFVPSGTMSNAIGIRAHTNPGDEIITEATSHIYIYEGGGYAALSGCSVALVPGKRGIMAPEDVAKAIRKGDGSRHQDSFWPRPHLAVNSKPAPGEAPAAPRAPWKAASRIQCFA